MQQPTFGGAAVVGKADKYAPYYPESKKDIGEKVTYAGLGTAGVGGFMLARNTEGKMRRRAGENLQRARMQRTLGRSRMRDATQKVADAKSGRQFLFGGSKLRSAEAHEASMKRGLDIANSRFKSAKEFATEDGVKGRTLAARKVGGGFAAAGLTMAAAPYALDMLNGRKKA